MENSLGWREWQMMKLCISLKHLLQQLKSLEADIYFVVHAFFITMG